MRSYSAIYVDVGYLISSAATRVTGTSLRGGVVIDYQRLIDALIAQVAQDTDLPLLRVNWYDSAAGRHGTADTRQQQIGLLPRVKLRLGRLNPLGEQKGVDIRIGLDLVAHAHSGAVDQMYLVTGDDDLTEAVEEAQTRGVQVILVVVPGKDDKPHGLSNNLQREADRMLLIDGEAIDETVHIKRMAPPTAAEAAAAAQQAAQERVQEPTREPAREPTQEPFQAASQVETDTGAPRPADPGAGTGRLPTPAAMPARKPAPGAQPSHAQPSHAQATSVPSSEIVYSSVGGLVQPEAPPDGWDDDVEDAMIDQVCRNVIESWAKSASAAQREELRTRRPQIPRDLDRTLLIDLSERIGVYDLSDPARFRLRDRFWIAVDELA